MRKLPTSLSESLNDFSLLEFLAKFEDGSCTAKELDTGFQYLIDTGLIYSLQGSYQRAALALLAAGRCHIRQTTDH